MRRTCAYQPSAAIPSGRFRSVGRPRVAPLKLQESHISKNEEYRGESGASRDAGTRRREGWKQQR